MNRSTKRGIAVSCLLAMAINLSACGYFLYPERKGQQGGRIDPVVVILDGAALLLGILPGVVAFAVDFTNGTIYLPPGGTSAIDRHLSGIDAGQTREVIDQYGRPWLEISVDNLAGEGDSMQKLTEALSFVTGRQIAAGDIIWLEDMTALREAVSQKPVAQAVYNN